jgi:hypothetical protein
MENSKLIVRSSKFSLEEIESLQKNNSLKEFSKIRKNT